MRTNDGSDKELGYERMTAGRQWATNKGDLIGTHGRLVRTLAKHAKGG